MGSGKKPAQVPPTPSATAIAQNVSQQQAAQNEDVIDNAIKKANKVNFLRMRGNAAGGGTFQ